MAKSDRFEKGMVVRRKVLGDAYVDQAMQKADDFSMSLQDFVTENAVSYTHLTLPTKRIV